MNLLVYILAFPVIWLVSVLPFRLLYAFSDFVYLFVYKIGKYRVKVVQKNLRIAFPNKTEAERRTIEKKFYHHMCDMFLEMVKSYHMSEKEIKRRMIYTNIELIKQYEASRSIIFLCGHYASYEWLMSLGYFLKHKSYGLYTPITNQYFDRLVRKIRMKHRAFLMSRYTAAAQMKKHRDENIIACYGFAADQSPSSSRSYRRTFLGKTVPVFTGAERLGKQLNTVMVYAKIEKVKRGYYQCTFEILAENPNDVPNYHITDLFFERLNQQIYQKPEYYLWTHNRFKRM